MSEEPSFDERHALLTCCGRSAARHRILVVETHFFVRRRWRQRTSVLLREKHIENVMRDGRRVRSMNAVLQEHDAGNRRMIARGEEHEPAVVAQVLPTLRR